jgi:hypothetical protein
MKILVAETIKSEVFSVKRIIIILILFSGYCLLRGQTSDNDTKSNNECLTIVKKAEKLFQDGLYDKCINDLEGVLRTCKLSGSEKLLVIELLARAYVESDDYGKAESAVNLLVNNFPHYELKEQENPESFNRLVKKYKIHPRLSLGIRNTLDWMNYKTTRIFYVDGLHYDAPYSKELEGILNDFNWMYYGWAELEFDRGISLNTDLIFKWTNFKREIKAPSFNLTFKEQDNYIEIPLYLKKYFHLGENLLPYVTAGMGWLKMTKATANVTIDYPDALSSVTTGDINMLEMRNKNTFEWIAGVGIGYKLKNLRLFLDARYYRGMNSITNPEKVIINSTLYNEYFYIDNSVRFNQFELGFSASYTILNSVKRDKY